jgi:hypothetical protein
MGIDANRLFFTNCCRNVLFEVRQRLYFHMEDIREELNVTPIFVNVRENIS